VHRRFFGCVLYDLGSAAVAEWDEIQEGWVVVWAINGSTTEGSTDELARERGSVGNRSGGKTALTNHTEGLAIALVRARRSLVRLLGAERAAPGASGEVNDRDI
jgi:hypothetical protein